MNNHIQSGSNNYFIASVNLLFNLSLIRCFKSLFHRKRLLHSRTIRIGHGPVCTGGYSFPPNVICNRKYNIFTFVPMVVAICWLIRSNDFSHLNQVLFQQFKFFLNLYFLLMACSQFFPPVQIGSPITYWGPLCFVLLITLIREFTDDMVRLIRDKEVNSEKYEKMTTEGKVTIKSS